MVPYRCERRVARSDARSTTDMSPTIDDECFPGHVVGTEQIENCLDDIFRRSESRERRRFLELRRVFLRPTLGEEYRPRSDTIHTNVRRERSGERASHVDDARFGYAVRYVCWPCLERREVRDVDDGAARACQMRRRGLGKEEWLSQVERHDRV